MKIFRTGAFLILASASLHAAEPGKSIQLDIGMNYSEALTQLKNSGAMEFPCSYKFAGTHCWYTLTNNLSIQIRGDKKSPDDELLAVSSLQVCNSTKLFCCKGEIWYFSDSIRLLDNVLSLGKPSVWIESTEKLRDVTFYLFKGMSFIEANKMLGKSGIKPLPVDESWLTQMPKGGNWARYTIKCQDDECELILNFGNDKPGIEPTIRTMLLEATKPEKPDRKAARYRVECEFLDLEDPLRKEWYWAFGEAWSWKPETNGQPDIMNAAGQRR